MSPSNVKKIKLAVLASFTLKGLDEVLKEQGKNLGVTTEVYTAPYNQIPQEILTPASGLESHAPDLTFVFWHPRSILGSAWWNPLVLRTPAERRRFIEEKITEQAVFMDAFQDRITGRVVVASLPLPTYSPLGIQEEKVEMSGKEMTQAFNQGLREYARGHPRVFVYDFGSFLARFGEFHVVKDSLYYLGDVFVSPQYLPQLAEDLMAFVKPAASRTRKCIVLDLDDTLWGGIVGEDGIAGIRLDITPPGNAYQDFQRYLQALNARGVLLAIASANNPEDAWRVIREHPHMLLREDAFAAAQINWDNKAENLSRIAAELNLGLDSLVFIDNDPVQRDLVRRLLPEVLVMDLPADPARYVRALQGLTDFNTFELTEEDLKRSQYYRQQRKVKELEQHFTNLEDFLKSLETKVSVQEVDDFSLPRIAQLTQRTNQFNLTTRRYSESDIEAMGKSGSHRVYGVRVQDRFGDYGLVGVAIVHANDPARWQLDAFLMSCRVIGRGIERQVLHQISLAAQRAGAGYLVGEYIPTAKNGLCKDFYTGLGFERISETQFELRDLGRLQPVAHIQVV